MAPQLIVCHVPYCDSSYLQTGSEQADVLQLHDMKLGSDGHSYYCYVAVNALVGPGAVVLCTGTNLPGFKPHGYQVRRTSHALP